MSDPRIAALRRIRDCGTVRFRFDDEGTIALFEQGFATATPVADDEDAIDYRLTGRGKALAVGFFQ